VTAFSLAEAREILERTPATLREMVGGLSDGWLAANEGPDTWNPREVIAHLADLEETDWITRARIIREEGEGRPFPPIDRVAFRTKLAGKSIDQLLAIFADRRATNLRTLDGMHLGATDLERWGTHPTFGAVTMGQLVATWAVHDLTHITQIVRVLARRYDADVGPWKEFLGVLKRG
jgi:hypothetical protein